MGKGGDIVVGNGKICRTIAGAGLRGVRSGQSDCQIRPRRFVCNRILAVADFGVRILVFSTVFQAKIPKNRKTVRYALTAGVFLAFDLALWHESIHAVGPGISTLLNSLQIFFLSAIGVFFFGERLSGLKKAGLISAVASVAMIAGAEFGYNGNAVWGFVSGLVSGLMLALSMVFVRKTHEIETVALFPSMMILSLGGAVSLVVPALLMDGGALYPTTWKDAGLVLVYGVVMQCFAWAMVAYAIPLLSLSLTGLLLLSEPVAALFIDYFGLGKPIEGVQWAGVALTLSAIYLGSLKQQSEP